MSIVSAMSSEWMEVDYPMATGTQPVSLSIKQAQAAMMKRVMRALNDKKPVMISVYIDTNAKKIEEFTFKHSTLQESGAPRFQGSHMVILEDYMVKPIKKNGEIISFNEGLMTKELQDLAIGSELEYLVAKNSWGAIKDEARGTGDGYYRFYADYLNTPLAITNETGAVTSHKSPLKSIILPVNY